ncbi:MAG TPA: transglycosylase SLT domain-containing protein [Candidatus Obscuribacter sp.]|nr:transglycosylase SLT domain-containing protein [Candidatus Obscuribacter sp.]
MNRTLLSLRSATEAKRRRRLDNAKPSRLLTATSLFLCLQSSTWQPLSAAPQSPRPAEFSQEIAALWQKPSRSFSQAIEALGKESREASIKRLSDLSSGFGGNVSTLEKRLADYVKARLLSKSSLAEERLKALELFTDTSAYPLLKTLCLWHCAELAAASGDEERLRTILSTIMRAHEAESQEIARATYELAQSYLRTAEVERAYPLLTSLKQRFASTEYAKGASYYLGQIALNQAAGSAAPAPTDAGNGDDLYNQALQHFREYLKNSTGGRFSPEVADKLISLGSGTAPKLSLSASDLDTIGLVYFKKGDYNRALSAWQSAQALPKPAADSRLLQKAQCLAKLGRREEALEVLYQGIARDPASTSYDEITDAVTGPLTRQQTAEVWRKIVTLKPKHLDHALWNLAVRSEDGEAIKLFERLLAEFPTSEHAPESLWWIFWHQTKTIYPGKIQANKVKAQSLARLADSGVSRYPRHRSAARFAFWSGKISEKLGNVQAAKLAYEHAWRHYPTNYYGGRARARLQAISSADKKDRGWSIHTSRSGPRQWNWPEAEALFSYDKLLPMLGAKAPMLALAGQYDEALAQLSPREQETVFDTPAGKEQLSGFKAYLFLRQGQEIDAIRAAGRDLGDIPEKTPRWQMLYPWAFASQIEDAARNNKVDPYLVHALIREESRYYPKALSRSNAIGLMQLLPGTAFGVAKRIGLPLAGKEDVFIPENNIKLGTNYLAYTLSRFSGHAMMAVASYNGGPNAVKRWLDQHSRSGGTDLDLFVENIPYRETRDYVRKVFGSYWTYEQMYPAVAPRQ